MAEEYEIVIGLEVHVHLKTESKLFCGCSTKFGSPPNSQTCPVCLGLPGVLPVLNKKAIELALRAALALNCEIQEYSKFDRKNYFYPDLPKNYQISQYDKPLSLNGYVDRTVDGIKKRIRIKRVHLEEDAGKLVHISASGQIGTAEESLVDLNRTGIPLLEIVSEPDIRSPEEAYEYLGTLKSILQYIDVSDCDMEKGTLRCDANISVRVRGEDKLGEKIEIKNLNSFKNVQKALEYESVRQIHSLKNGEKLVQETRLWNADESITYPMRTKEEAHDYRYFPEPDLMPLNITKEMIEEIKKSLVELPLIREQRFIKEYNLPEYDAKVLTSFKDIADYFELCVSLYNKPKAISNFVMVDLSGLLNLNNIEITQSPIRPGKLVKLIKLIDDGVISSKIAKMVFEEMFSTGEDPELIVKKKGLVQITDEKVITEIVEKVICDNPGIVQEYKSGKEKAIGNLIGQVMKASGGLANPQIVNKILKEKIK
ncbi:MAG: Asp-tRNA(Asn)/Glu-tRNA(Gln) amidotransferase subunit GatB [Candidatus Firestonebacteria bacterium]